MLPRSELYIQKDGAAGVDQFGLAVYWCLRGTSYEEGMHGQLNKLFKGGHYAPELTQVGRSAYLFCDVACSNHC